MKDTFKLLLAASCMLSTATPSYAWLDKLDTKEKLAIGAAAVGAIHNMAKAEEQQEEVKATSTQTKPESTAKTNKPNNRIDNLITGKFGFELGAKMDENKCLKKDRNIGFCHVKTGGNKYFNDATVNYNPETLEVYNVMGVKKTTLKYDYASNMRHSDNVEQANKEYALECQKQYNFVVDALMQKGFKESDLQRFPLAKKITTQNVDFLVGENRKHSFICMPGATTVGKINFGAGWSTEVTYVLTYTDNKLLLASSEADKRAVQAKRNIKAKAAVADF